MIALRRSRDAYLGANAVVHAVGFEPGFVEDPERSDPASRRVGFDAKRAVCGFAPRDGRGWALTPEPRLTCDKCRELGPEALEAQIRMLREAIRREKRELRKLPRGRRGETERVELGRKILNRYKLAEALERQRGIFT